MSILMAGYALINSVIQLYTLQIINGVLVSVQDIMTTAILGDLTEIGKYQAITISMAETIFIGGYLVQKTGVDLIFYGSIFLTAVSASILIALKER